MTSCLLATNTAKIRDRLRERQQPIIVGVAGDSGSGKTTFSDGIRRLIGSDLVATICTDGYHKENRQQRQESGRLPLDPEANHLDQLASDLKDLKANRSIAIPIYNHGTGDFDHHQPLPPKPIIVVEGLHVLYPQFLPYLDFRLYVDPNREVKWQWKWERDVKKRGHKAESLEAEMLQREAAFIRWIDFQKIYADVVIQVGPSQLNQALRLNSPEPTTNYRVNLILDPAQEAVPSLALPFDLATMVEADSLPFLLSSSPIRYWGRKAIELNIDGVLPEITLVELERFIAEYTGITVGESFPDATMERGSAIPFSQLLIAWRFLEQINTQPSELTSG